MRVKKKMGRFGRYLYRSSRKTDRNESAKSEVRGFLDDLPPVEEVFPFFNFQPEFDLFSNDSSHPSELDISKFSARNSLEIKENLYSFPTYSQHEWIWLGEEGLDASPLDPICGAPPSNLKDSYDVPPLEPICGAPPSNPIDFDQFTSMQESVYFKSNAYAYEEIEKRDYFKKKVRFEDHESKQTKRKTEPDKYSMYESSRKKANIFREWSSLVSTQSQPSVVEHPSKIRDNFARKYERPKGPVHSDTMPLKEPSKSRSIECIRFDTVAEILAFASALSEKESESTAGNKDQVTSRRSSRSVKVKQEFSVQEVKIKRDSSSTYIEYPIADRDTRQENRMMENLVISPESSAASIKNSSIDSGKTENYFFASHPSSSREGERKTYSRSGLLSQVKSEVMENEEPPRRSTRIHLRQCRGKQNNLIEPLWAETEWWVK